MERDRKAYAKFQRANNQLEEKMVKKKRQDSRFGRRLKIISEVRS
jgi:hypothetical protein